ncbi:unnamed protein product [Symbiodinium sp. KB8]|nr:unnamed protein product [Symbiodinium sp. KB8]
MSPLNATGNEEDGLLLKLITKGVDGSEIGTYAYRVTDASVVVEYENAKIDLPDTWRGKSLASFSYPFVYTPHLATPRRVRELVIFQIPKVSLLRELQTDPDDAVVISLASFTNESFAIRSLNFFSAEGAVLETTSEDPIRLGLQVLEEDPSAECAFWHEVEQRWSTQGMSVDSLGNGTATCAIRYDLLPLVSARDGEAQDVDGEVQALPPRKPSLFGFILQAVGATFACSLASQIFSVEEEEENEELAARKGQENLRTRKGLENLRKSSEPLEVDCSVGLLLQAHRADKQYEQRLEQLLRKEAARASPQGSIKGEMLIEKAKKENIFFVKLRLLEIRQQRLGLQSGLLGMGARGMVADRAHWSILQARLGVDSTFLHSLYQDTRDGRPCTSKRGSSLKTSMLRAFADASHTAYCSWVRVLEPSLRVTCLERAAVALCKFYSGLAVAAVFYSQAAVAPGQDEGCSIFQDPLAQLIRTAVVAWVSAMVGLLPFLALMPLFEKLRSMELKTRHIIFWSFISTYLLTCILVVCIFQSLVSYKDTLDWMYSAAQTLAFSLILQGGPGPENGSAAVVLLFVRFGLVGPAGDGDVIDIPSHTCFRYVTKDPVQDESLCNSANGQVIWLTEAPNTMLLRFSRHSANIDLDEHLPFHAKDDHCYKVILRNMTVSGEEGQNQAQRSQLCARWEIAGHPVACLHLVFRMQGCNVARFQFSINQIAGRECAKQALSTEERRRDRKGSWRDFTRCLAYFRTCSTPASGSSSSIIVNTSSDSLCDSSRSPMAVSLSRQY